MTYRSRVTTTTIFHCPPALSPNFFNVFWVKAGSKFKFHLSNPQKKLPWRERHMRGDVSIDATWWRKKKGQKLSCVKLAICPDHPRWLWPLKFCMRGRVREVVIYFKFYENRLRGLGAVGSKIALSHWLGPWLIQQLVLPYKPWWSDFIMLVIITNIWCLIYKVNSSNNKLHVHIVHLLLLEPILRRWSNSRPNITSSTVSLKLSSLNGFQSAMPVADSGRFGELNRTNHQKTCMLASHLFNLTAETARYWNNNLIIFLNEI